MKLSLFLSVLFTTLFYQLCTATEALDVVGGTDTVPGKFPHMVMILKHNNFVCGGSLVAKNVVLTAKHCVIRTASRYVRVRLGEHDRRVREGYEQDISVKRIYLHPTSAVDAAVLILSRDAYMSARVKTIQLHNQYLGIGAEVTVSGWGWSVSNGGSGSTARRLQEITLPVAQPATCQRGGVSIRAGEFCAGQMDDSYRNACHGDSGGPAVIKDPFGRLKLAGVVVRGVGGCPEYADYAAFLSVSYIRSWVNNRINDANMDKDVPIPTVKPEAPTTKKGCFSLSSSVETPVGSKPLAEVSVGDIVLSLGPNNQPKWSPVIMNIHYDRQLRAEFVKLDTKDHHSLKLTPEHLIFIMKGNKPEAIFARDVKPGDQVMIVNDISSQAQLTNVSKASTVFETGVISPLTEEGTVVVDSVAASCYALISSHATAHAAFAPLRWLSGVYSPSGEGQDGVHWYPGLMNSLLVGTVF